MTHTAKATKPQDEHSNPGRDKPQGEALRTLEVERPKQMLKKALIGAIVGAIVGLFMVKGIPGAALGAVLAWYLVRGLWVGMWAAVIGAVLGYFFIESVSGAIAGMVVGVMIACNIVGRRGRWIVLAVVAVLVVVAVMENEWARHHIMGLFRNHE